MPKLFLPIFRVVNHLLDRLSPRIILTGAGIALMLSGLGVLLALALGLAGDGDDDGVQAMAADGATASAGLEGGSSVQPGTPSSSGAQAMVIGEDGKPVPYWKAKQDRARQAQEQTATADAGTGSEQAPAEEALQAQGGGDPAPASPPATQPPVPTTRQVGTEGSTPLEGIWGGTARQLSDYLLASNPVPRFSVPTLQLAEYYVRHAAQVKLRADILWAQMIHETGYGKYGGSVRPEQNNYAGIGATGGGVPGYTFATAELGVQAHIAHMVAYVYPTDMAPWTNTSVDPRYDKVQPRGIAKLLRDLDGRWAVPGVGYGARIENHVRALNP